MVFVLFICLFQFNFMFLSEDREKIRAEGTIKKSRKKEKSKNQKKSIKRQFWCQFRCNHYGDQVATSKVYFKSA